MFKLSLKKIELATTVIGNVNRAKGYACEIGSFDKAPIHEMPLINVKVMAAASGKENRFFNRKIILGHKSCGGEPAFNIWNLTNN
jgi:hypothetical protein